MSSDRATWDRARVAVLGAAAVLLASACGGRAGVGEATADAGSPEAEAGSEDAPGDLVETGAEDVGAPDSGDAGDAGADATLDATEDAAAEAGPDADLTVVGNGAVLDGSVSWWPADGVFLTKVTAPGVPAAGTLVDIATIAQPDEGDAGVIQFALYGDDAGLPDSLLASSAPFAVVAGQNQAPASTSPVAIVGGTPYWVGLFVVSAQDTVHLYQQMADSADVELGTSSLPAFFPPDSVAVTAGPNLNLFLLVRY